MTSLPFVKSTKSPIGEQVMSPEQSMRDVGESSSNNFFNILRAAAEATTDIITRIDCELASIEFKKQELLLEREANDALRTIGQDYMTRLNELRQRGKRPT